MWSGKIILISILKVCCRVISKKGSQTDKHFWHYRINTCHLQVSLQSVISIAIHCECYKGVIPQKARELFPKVIRCLKEKKKKAYSKSNSKVKYCELKISVLENIRNYRFYRLWKSTHILLYLYSQFHLAV